MGFRYRKSINLGGGFRVNLSKSGVGYSWGGRGYRVTHTANGRTRRTISIPGTGLSWVDESGSGRKRAPARRSGNGASSSYGRTSNAGSGASSSYGGAATAGIGAQTYNAGGEAALEPASENARRLIHALKTRAILFKTLVWLGVAALVLLTLGGAPGAGLATGALTIVGAYLLRSLTRVAIEYEFDPAGEAREARRKALIAALAESQALWQVETINLTTSQKHNAGAANRANRKSVRVEEGVPPYVRTNGACHALELRQGRLWLLPDRALLRNSSGWSVIEYSQLHADVATTKLAETTRPTPDSTIVESVWRYVNADGSPDMRFRDNVQIPVCVRGQVSFRTDSGFSAIFYLSSLDATKKVNAQINSLRSQY